MTEWEGEKDRKIELGLKVSEERMIDKEHDEQRKLPTK